MDVFKRRNRRPLRLEPLEPRILLDGDVTVTFVGSTRTGVITGDSLDNDIEVVQVTEDVFQVTGLSGTTLNGGTDPLVIPGKVKHLKIRMGDGDDFVDATFIKLRRKGNIDMGAGNDILTVTGPVDRHLTIKGGSGDDDIGVSGVTVARDLTINAGDGVDMVVVWDSSAGSTTINGGDGDDSLSVKNVTTRKTTINGGDGANDVEVDNVTLARDLSIKTGDGADTVSVKNSTTGNTTINGGDGDNNVKVDTHTTGNADTEGNLTIKTGKGNDTIRTKAINAKGKVHIDHGAGNDTVEQGESGSTSTIGGRLKIQGEDVHATVVDTNVTGNVVLKGGTGDCTSILQGVTGSGGLFVSTAGGHDGVDVLDCDFARGSLKTRGGDDTCNMAGSSFQEWFNVLTGPGAGNCTIDSSHVGGNLKVQQGTGVNWFDIQKSTVDGSWVIHQRGGDDTIQGSHVSVGRNVNVKQLGGNDDLLFNEFTVWGTTTVHQGDGNNNATIQDTTLHAPLVMRGECGTDHLNVLNVTSTATTVSVSFFPGGGSNSVDVNGGDLAGSIAVSSGAGPDVVVVNDTSSGGGFIGRFGGGDNSATVQNTGVYLPLVLRGAGGLDDFLVQNVTSGGPSVSVSFYTGGGTSNVDVLGSDFSGSVLVSSSGPVAAVVNSTNIDGNLVNDYRGPSGQTDVINSVIGGTCRFNGAGGAEVYSFDTVTCVGGAWVRSRGGDDEFYSTNVSSGRIDLKMGGGADTVIFDNQICYCDWVVNAGGGNDIVATHRLDIQGGANCSLGSGNDGLSWNDTACTGDARVFGQDGDDTLAFERKHPSLARSVFDQHFWVFAGGGHDTVLIGVPGEPDSGIWVLGNFTAHGGPGTDCLDEEGNGNTYDAIIDIRAFETTCP
jgi:hypothetical protein